MTSGVFFFGGEFGAGAGKVGSDEEERVIAEPVGASRDGVWRSGGEGIKREPDATLEGAARGGEDVPARVGEAHAADESRAAKRERHTVEFVEESLVVGEVALGAIEAGLLAVRGVVRGNYTRRAV